MYYIKIVRTVRLSLQKISEQNRYLQSLELHQRNCVLKYAKNQRNSYLHNKVSFLKKQGFQRCFYDISK